MTSHTHSGFPHLSPIATPVPTMPRKLPLPLRQLATSFARVGRFAGARLACGLRGHERWTTESGDWVCMRCGKLEIVEVPRNAVPLGIRARRDALPRFE